MVIEVPWPVAVLVLLALVAAAVAWSRWQVNRRRATMARQAAGLGLEPVAESDPELQRRFLRLQRERVGQPRIALAWKREEPFGRLYVLDLWVEKQDARELEGGYVLVVSPHLTLPRFGLFPKVDLPGMMAPLARRFRDHVINRLGPVSFDDHPEFSRDYMVVGDDQDAIRHFLSEPRLRELGRLKHRRLEADGDMFSYSRSEPGQRRLPNPWIDLRDRLDEARAICRAFRSEA